MSIRHAASALWAMRSRASKLQYLHKAQLRHASMRELFWQLYHFFRECDLETVPEWQQDLRAGDRLELHDEKTGRQKTLLVTVPAYRNRFGEWMPAKMKDVTGQYEPGNGPHANHTYNELFFGDKA
jgi:hypothetical protein